MTTPRYSHFLKRSLDLAISVPLFLVTLPVMAACALAIRLTMGSPILFRQERPGFQERSFMLRKFRTMRHPDDPRTALLTDAQRLTRLGSLLRKTSLDELPQLWHVVIGEMSLVGPRPLLPQYLPRYSAFQRRRHECLPGITGWAQIQGRNAVDWDRRFELDVWYVDHRSLWLDLRILAKTLWMVLGGGSKNRLAHVTPPEFMGSGAPCDTLNKIK